MPNICDVFYEYAYREDHNGVPDALQARVSNRMESKNHTYIESGKSLRKRRRTQFAAPLFLTKGKEHGT